MSILKAIAIGRIVGGGGGGSAVLITKTVTEPGTYSARSDNADGYSSVTVDIPDGDSIGY